MLVWSALLCLVIPFVYIGGIAQVPGGLLWGLGNRDTPLELPVWVGRARRAHANMVENLAPFAVLVLTAHVAGAANSATALGATLFFWGRVAHFAVYCLGIPYLRTLVFAVAVIGEIMILAQLFA
jgi:uncharacterized MAPEG superfamily protein